MGKLGRKQGKDHQKKDNDQAKNSRLVFHKAPENIAELTVFLFMDNRSALFFFFHTISPPS